MAIVLNHVSHKYNEFSKDNSINDISLEIPDNKIIGIIGKSGSGKTTLLQLINGLIKPTSGSIKIDDISDISKLRRNIGLVFQLPEQQFFEVNVEKEIGFALKNFNMSKSKIKESLKLVGFEDSYLKRNLNELSNGEKRIIAILSVLVYNPKIILFDEPTIGLDYKNKKKIIQLIKMLKNRYNKTIIIVSHDIDMLYEMVDDIIVLDKGKLIMYGDPESIFKENDIVKEYDIDMPKIIKFEMLVKDKKNIKLMHTTSINDLIKEVYRNV